MHTGVQVKYVSKLTNAQRAKGKIFSLLDCGKGKWDRET